MKVVVKADILGRNDAAAAENAALFAQHGIYALNLLGSPGAGKTSLLERTLQELAGDLRVAVVEGDLFTTKDAARIERCGAPVVQINTSGGTRAPRSRCARSPRDRERRQSRLPC